MSAANINDITKAIIGAAIEVHKHLGPGLLESAYAQCLCRELEIRGIAFETEKALPVEYKGLKLNCGYRIDLLVMGRVVVEIKAVDKLIPIHDAQVLSYLKMGGWKVGLLINFHTPILIKGVRRLVCGLEESKMDPSIN